MKRQAQIGAGIVVSAVCLVLAIRGLELEQVGHALAGASYVWLVPGLALYFAGVWIRAVRWRLLLRPLKDISSRRLFPVVVIGYMANDVLPARLGEVARCYVLRRREGVTQTAALATVVLERVMDGLTMLAFMGAVLPLLPFSATLYRLMAAAGAVFGAVTLVMIVVVARPSLAMVLLDLVVRPLPAHLAQRIREFSGAFLGGLASLGGAGATLRIFGLSCVAWLFEAGMYFALMFSFPLDPSLALAVLTTAVINLGTLIPSSPGYVGVFDVIGRSVLAQFGVPGAAALAYVVVVHATLVVPITLLGFWFAWREGVSLERLSRGKSASPALQNA